MSFSCFLPIQQSEELYFHCLLLYMAECVVLSSVSAFHSLIYVFDWIQFELFMKPLLESIAILFLFSLFWVYSKYKTILPSPMGSDELSLDVFRGLFGLSLSSLNAFGCYL